jgi:hypothetical protein
LRGLIFECQVGLQCVVVVVQLRLFCKLEGVMLRQISCLLVEPATFALHLYSIIITRTHTTEWLGT